VLAPNLYGYGETTAWRRDGDQTLADQANLIVRLVEQFAGSVSLVGHSFGGSVALKAATVLGDRVSHLFLFEPNPLRLLAQNNPSNTYVEAIELRDFVKRHGAKGNWAAVAERFMDYWLGDGAWAETPEKRREAYMSSLHPNYYEWDCLQADDVTIDDIASISARAMLVLSTTAQPPIREIAKLIEEKCPNWSFATVAEGGHMAMATHPHLVNRLVTSFLRGG
jgi:pimeloyl-ACP methyl ester carboxylesterase